MIVQSLRGFGDAPPPEAVEGLNGMMDDVVSSLRSAIVTVRARIELERSAEVLSLVLVPITAGQSLYANLFTSSAEMKSAILSYLNSMENIITRLDGPSRADVLSGELKQEKWLAGAQPVADGLAEQLKALGEDSTLENLKFTISNAPKYLWQDLSRPTFAPDLWMYVVPIAVVVGAIAFLPQILAAEKLTFGKYRRRR
jgi:hypothetical protein